MKTKTSLCNKKFITTEIDLTSIQIELTAILYILDKYIFKIYYNDILIDRVCKNERKHREIQICNFGYAVSDAINRIQYEKMD